MKNSSRVLLAAAGTLATREGHHSPADALKSIDLDTRRLDGPGYRRRRAADLARVEVDYALRVDLSVTRPKVPRILIRPVLPVSTVVGGACRQRQATYRKCQLLHKFLDSSNAVSAVFASIAWPCRKAVASQASLCVNG